MYPLRRTKQSAKGRRWRLSKSHVIAAIWALGVAISVPEYLMFSAEPFCYNKQLYYDCRQLWSESISNRYAIFLYLCTFVVPLTLLTYLYARIGYKLWRSRVPGNVDLNRDLSLQTKRVKVIKMLFVVVILFAVSWLPLQTFSMIILLFPEFRQDFEYKSTAYNVFICTYFFCHWLSMFHSCLNPLIYCFMNGRFRSDLHRLIILRPRWRRPTTTSTNHNQSNYLKASQSSTNHNHNHTQQHLSHQQQPQHLQQQHQLKQITCPSRRCRPPVRVTLTRAHSGAATEAEGTLDGALAPNSAATAGAPTGCENKRDAQLGGQKLRQLRADELSDLSDLEADPSTDIGRRPPSAANA